MCFRVIISGVRLLIGAVLWSLLALSAIAHPTHANCPPSTRPDNLAEVSFQQGKSFRRASRPTYDGVA